MYSYFKTEAAARQHAAELVAQGLAAEVVRRRRQLLTLPNHAWAVYWPEPAQLQHYLTLEEA